MSSNPESILDSVKKALGIDGSDTSFDLDITLFINAGFGNLQQVGIGGDEGFVIADNTTLWSQYVTSLLYLNQVKQYIFTWVKLSFDPPANSWVTQSYERVLEELINRILTAVEQENPPSDPFKTTPEQAAEDAGLVFFRVKPVNLVSASVITLDAKAGNIFYLTLAEDAEILAPVNGINGQHINLELACRGFAVTWGNGWNFGNPGTPTLSVGRTDIISAIYNESVAQWYAGFTPGF